MIAFLIPAVVAVANVVAPPPGLYVRDGVLMHQGKPYNGIGVNYFNCFARVLKDPSDTSYDRGFAELQRLGVPFVRFMCGGFWPVEMDLHKSDRRAYFQRLDRVVRSAEKHGIGLIPSLYWNICTTPDLAGEPVSAWGDPGSKTHAFMRSYTAELVRRYGKSRAIWAWEFGNEYNLAADLPNAAEHRPPVWPALGTAASRSEKDELTHAMFRTALVEFAREVRKHDRNRAIISGNSIPRPSAWHQQKELSWTKDTPEQFTAMLLGDNPDPLDTLCIHAYAPEDLERLPSAASAAIRAAKPLFVGEFGVEGPETDQAREKLIALLRAIAGNRIPLAALWVYDFGGQDKSWNVTWDNERAFQLRMIADANRRLQAGGR